MKNRKFLRFDRLLPLAATALVLLSACGAVESSTAHPPGTSVPVEAGAANWSSDNFDEIVVTELYPYEGDQSRSDFNYIVDGPPLSFAFPEAAYGSQVNGHGGPQWSVNLRIDRETMEPFSVLALEAGLRSWQRAGSNLRELRERQMLIRVHSNLSRPSTSLSAEYWLGEAPKREIGAICGFDFARTRPTNEIYSDQPNQPIGGRLLPFGEYHGLAHLESHPPLLASCSMASPDCTIGFDYAGRQVTFDLPRESFCEHGEYIQRISVMLDSHRLK